MRYLSYLTNSFFAVFLSISVWSENSHELKIFDLNKSYNKECISNKKCYKIQELVKTSLHSSIDSREEVLRLYQARAAVKIKLGQILPQLDLDKTLSAAVDLSASIDTGLPFVGFLFPNRWFDWKSSRILKKAETEVLHTVLVNRAQAILGYTYDIQMQKWSIRILEFYIQEINNLINYLSTYRQSGPYKVTQEDLAVLENMKAKFIFSRAYIDALSAVLPQLATALGLDPNFDWSSLMIEDHDFKSIKKEQRREYQEFWPEALKQSTEIKNIKYLVEAAKANKKSNYFDFLDPDSSINCGYGFGPRINTARSNVAIIELQLQRTTMQLSNAIQNALNNYNDAIDSFPGLENGLMRLDTIRAGVQEHINNTNTALDINRIVRHFKYAKGQALLYVSSYFTFRAAEADLNRYTWSGGIYNIVRDYINYELPSVLEEARKAQSFRYALKRKIKL